MKAKFRLIFPVFNLRYLPATTTSCNLFFSTIKTSMTKKPFDVEINPSSFFSFLFGFFCIII